jgi:hypothetical protein
VRGEAVFGIDVSLPGMLTALVAHSADVRRQGAQHRRPRRAGGGRA